MAHRHRAQPLIEGNGLRIGLEDQHPATTLPRRIDDPGEQRPSDPKPHGARIDEQLFQPDPIPIDRDLGQSAGSAASPPRQPCSRHPIPRRQLLRFRAGQEVAEIERVEEVFLAHPSPILDQLAVHQRDLPRRSAEAQQADAQERA